MAFLITYFPFLLAVAPLFVLWLFFRRVKYAGLLLLPTFVIQVAATYLYSQTWDVGDVAYAGGGAVILFWALVVFFGLVGLVVYPVLLLAVGKPRRWKLSLRILLSVYVLVLLVPFTILFMRGLLLPNVAFHGIVLGEDGKPVPNARIRTSNCWGRSTFVADEEGRFEVSTYCSSVLVIKSIVEPTGNANCLSSWNEKRRIGRTELMYLVQEQWARHDEEHPFMFGCVWHEPATLAQGTADWLMMVPDGRTYTLVLADRNKKPKLMEGRHPGLIRLRMFAQESDGGQESYYKSGQLIMEPVDGGIKAVNSKFHNLVDDDGFSPQYVKHFENAKHFYAPVYFNSNNRSEYGYLDLHVDFTYKGGNDGAVAMLRYRINWGGGRAIVKRP